MTRGATASRTWKGFELRICKALGIERISKRNLGEESVDGIGIVKFTIRAILAVEIKIRASVSKLVNTSIDQAEKDAKNLNLYPESIQKLIEDGMPVIPIAILKDKHASDDSSIVAMRFKDFKSVLRSLPTMEDDGDE